MTCVSDSSLSQSDDKVRNDESELVFTLAPDVRPFSSPPPPPPSSEAVKMV